MSPQVKPRKKNVAVVKKSKSSVVVKKKPAQPAPKKAKAVKRKSVVDEDEEVRLKD